MLWVGTGLLLRRPDRSLGTSWMSVDIVKKGGAEQASTVLIGAMGPLVDLTSRPGICGEMTIATPVGVRPVHDLRVGDLVQASGGNWAKVTEVRHSTQTDNVVALPEAPSSPAAVVSCDQLLVCRHFLCKALFGAPSVLLHAGAVTGPGVRPAVGSSQTLYDLRFETPTILRIGGYEFYFCSSAARDCGAVDSGWAGGDGHSDGRSSHSGIAQGPDLPAQPVLTKEQARQLCDAGVIFRGVSRGVQS
jgi:hypothetical protein